MNYILLFYTFIVFKKKINLNSFYWLRKYSKTKNGHNFLPVLVRRNLNADLSLSVLRKKIISKIKIVNSDAFSNLIY